MYVLFDHVYMCVCREEAAKQPLAPELNSNVDDVSIFLNNLMNDINQVIQDYNDAKAAEKANGISQQTGPLPLMVGPHIYIPCTSSLTYYLIQFEFTHTYTHINQRSR